MINYLIEENLTLANNGARDGNFDFIDAYLIWFVIVNNYFLKEYLRTYIINLPPGIIQKTGINKIGPNKTEYPAFNGVIYGYIQLVPFEQKKNIKNYLYNHFRNSNIQNLNNVYNELIRLTNTF